MIFPSLEGLFISGIDCLHECFGRCPGVRHGEFGDESPRYADVGLPLPFYMSRLDRFLGKLRAQNTWHYIDISSVGSAFCTDRNASGYNASVHNPSKYFDKLSDVAWIASGELFEAFVPFANPGRLA